MRPWIIECVFPNVKDHSLRGKGETGRDDGIGNWGVGDGRTGGREGVFDPERNWQRLVRGAS